MQWRAAVRRERYGRRYLRSGYEEVEAEGKAGGAAPYRRSGDRVDGRDGLPEQGEAVAAETQGKVDCQLI